MAYDSTTHQIKHYLWTKTIPILILLSQYLCHSNCTHEVDHLSSCFAVLASSIRPLKIGTSAESLAWVICFTVVLILTNLLVIGMSVRLNTWVTCLNMLPALIKIYVHGIMSYREPLLLPKCFVLAVVPTQNLQILQQSHPFVRLAKAGNFPKWNDRAWTPSPSAIFP